MHPDYKKYKYLSPPLFAGALPLANAVLTKALQMTGIGNGMEEKRYVIKGYKSGKVRLHVISPAQCDAALPALVYFHGGAFALQAAPFHKKLLAEYASGTPCKVVFVDYRLLPKATFPTGLEDCFFAYKWVVKNAERLGVNPNRIAVGGDSAGGALSIGVCRLARKRKLPPPCFQMLIYPVTDARQNTQSMITYTDTPLWNSKANAKMWRMYLKDVPPGKRIDASPAAAVSLTGQPPTYIEVAEYDCLRDEGIAFAKVLRKNGIPTVLYKTRGTIHGFEIAWKNKVVRESVIRRINLLKNFLNMPDSVR
jgi:acetyl esterase/lipase